MLTALDQVGTTLLGGFPDETMSSYAHRMRLQSKPAGFLADWIDAWARILFGQADHCRKSYMAERARVEFPPELR